MKLKVGDIEMDSESGVTFAHGHPPAAPSRPAHDRNSAPYQLLGVPVPAWPASVYWALSALGGTAFVGMVALLPALLAQSASLALCTLLPPLLGLALGSAVIARGAGRKRPALASPETHALRATRIAALLSTSASPLGVERIAAALGWTEEAVVTGIGYLLARERVREDLDLDTGHWVYALRTRADGLAPAALPIRERQDAIPGPASQG